MIVEYVIQNPGQMEQYNSDYRGYRSRTVIFLSDWATAQFFEIDGKLIEHWREGEVFTSYVGQNYSSMNCSLVPRKFMTVYHNEDITVTDNGIKSADESLLGSSGTSGIIQFNSDSGKFERQL